VAASSGRVREGRTPPAHARWLVQESPTLGEIVRDINKYSNNVMARQLFLTLDSERPGDGRGRAPPDRRLAAGEGI
jgi:D-alanyl-D-alanine carboxypeptidase/D-alanyl-D-alanine-endopeptidase (penicillin-binding protein 4)